MRQMYSVVLHGRAGGGGVDCTELSNCPLVFKRSFVLTCGK